MGDAWIHTKRSTQSKHYYTNNDRLFCALFASIWLHFVHNFSLFAFKWKRLKRYRYPCEWCVFSLWFIWHAIKMSVKCSRKSEQKNGFSHHGQKQKRKKKKKFHTWKFTAFAFIVRQGFTFDVGQWANFQLHLRIYSAVCAHNQHIHNFPWENFSQRVSPTSLG